MPAKTRSDRTKQEVQKKKSDYFEKVSTLLEEYPKFILINCDNLSSKLIQKLRCSLRPSESVLLMGKNTLIKKAVKLKLQEHSEWEQILPFLHQNIGFIFTKGSLTTLRESLQFCTVATAAKTGMVAPSGVVLPKKVTTLEPSKTVFFASRGIPTRITKGNVEILSEITLCEKGKKVGCSEATLLQLLDIKPFVYGPTIVQCFDEIMFPPELLDFTESPLCKAMCDVMSFQEAVSLAQTYPLLHTFPDSGIGFRSLGAVPETNFKDVEGIKDYLDTLASALPLVQERETELSHHTDQIDDDSSGSDIVFDMESIEKNGDVVDDEGIMDFF